MAAAGFSVLPQVQGRCLADISDIPPVVPDCCIIIAISKTSARTSVIYALQLEDGGCIKGTPFRLYQPNGRDFFWPNRTITRESISFGSVLRCQAIGDILTYRSNTAKRMFVDQIQMELVYGESVFKSIKEACPDAVLDQEMGVYLVGEPENPQNFLVSLRSGVIENEQLIFRTKEDRRPINLKLNCREHLTLSTGPVHLEIRDVQDEEDVGDTALISFTTSTASINQKKSTTGFYPAVCEGLILKYKPKVISTDEEPVKIMNRDGNMIFVPGSVKFDTGNDAATAISHGLMDKLHLKTDRSKRISVTGIGGHVLDCCRVKICLLIRKRVFKVDALVGAVAPQTDLLIGNEIIEQLAKENFSIG